MVQTKSTALTVNAGEEIGIALGAKMISDYRMSNPNDVTAHYIGRNILLQILAQPGCVGIKFYNAYNETGSKTLVYVGVNAEGNDMLNITTINQSGTLESRQGIVADRVIPIKDDENTWWSFE